MSDKKPTQKEQREELRKNPVNDFTCLHCQDAKPMPVTDFRKHLEEVHKMIGREALTGRKEMRMHIDGSWYYSSSYFWTFPNGVTALQHTSQVRERLYYQDPMGE